VTGIENPQLDEMRERLAERLEAEFALMVIDPEPIAVPGEEASVLGQLQARDGAGGKLAFYLRPTGTTPLVPIYVSRLSRAAYAAETGVRVCVVLDAEDSDAEEDARACGAGLLVLTSESLTQVVEPSLPTDALNEGEFQEFAADVRREIIRAAQFRLSELESSYHDARKVVDPADAGAKEMLREIKKQSAACDRWQEKLVKESEDATRRSDREALEALNEKALNDDPGA
jgi:hypothetical protein